MVIVVVVVVVMVMVMVMVVVMVVVMVMVLMAMVAMVVVMVMAYKNRGGGASLEILGRLMGARGGGMDRAMISSLSLGLLYPGPANGTGNDISCRWR